MNSYLLLRDNKETGPYTLDELVNFGMKPYDLVWVSGKSAAWRYPSEVQELKPYAPAVEEQPYDRFYKKSLPADVQEAVPAIVKENEITSAYQPKVIPEKEPSFVPKKSVFVTLPGQQRATAEKKVPTEIKKTIPQEEIPAQTIIISENPAAAKVKYSQPLDDIKEMYVKTLQDRKSRMARKSFWLKNLKVASVVLGLVGVGVLAGFILKPGAQANHSQQAIVPAAAVITPGDQRDTVAIEPTPQENEDVSNPPTDPVAAPQQPPREKSPETVQKRPAVTAVDAKEPETGQTEKAVMKPKGPPVADTKNPTNEEKQFYLGAESNPISGERTRTVRDNNAERNAGAAVAATDKPEAKTKAPLDEQVTVTSNEYKKVAFGGIRDLRLTVTNHSKYELDNVVVELQYLKPSELPLKTDNILFRSIQPNESATIRVPDTNRGIKVVYRIVSIGSKTAMK